jgi:hypothetical protein
MKQEQIKLTISNDQIADIMSNIDEAISYWGSAPENKYDYQSDKRLTVQEVDEHDKTVINVVTDADIVRGIELFAENFPTRLSEIFGSDMDCYTTSNILQYAIHGEIIYA